MNEQKQIEEMALAICKSRGVANVNDCRECRCHEDCLYQEIANGLYKAGYRKQEWISVKERLPKNNLARVLVFLKDDEFTRPIGFNKIDTDRCIDGKWARWGKYVTHWMPLPEPPKGE